MFPFPLSVGCICLLITVVTSFDQKCCSQYATRITQSMIRQPIPLIINSQVMEEQKGPNDQKSEGVESKKTEIPSMSTVIASDDTPRKSLNKPNGYEMTPMIESAEWNDYPSTNSYYPSRNYFDQSQNYLTPTHHRYDLNNRLPNFYSNYHHFPFASSSSPPLSSLSPPFGHFPGHHGPFDFPELSSSKSHIEEIALFIVVLTIAGLFGLLIAMFIPFILLLQGGRGTLIPANAVVPVNQPPSSQMGKRRKRDLANSLHILRSIHETSQRYRY